MKSRYVLVCGRPVEAPWEVCLSKFSQRAKSKQGIDRGEPTDQTPALLQPPQARQSARVVSADAGNRDPSPGKSPPPNLSFHLSTLFVIVSNLTGQGNADLHWELCNVPRKPLKHTNVIGLMLFRQHNNIIRWLSSHCLRCLLRL